MKIYNKVESYNKIIELGLNRFPEKIFKAGQLDLVDNFISQYPAKFYAIRDKSKAGGVFKLAVEPQNIKEQVKEYSNYSINVSSYNYVDNQLLVGEILISGTIVSAILSTNGSYSVRDATRNPDFNITTNIFDDKTLNEIPHFDKIYQYIVSNKLQDIIVEFAYFNIPVGINNENIVVYELRTEY